MEGRGCFCRASPNFSVSSSFLYVVRCSDRVVERPHGSPHAAEETEPMTRCSDASSNYRAATLCAARPPRCSPLPATLRPMGRGLIERVRSPSRTAGRPMGTFWLYRQPGREAAASKATFLEALDFAFPLPGASPGDGRSRCFPVIGESAVSIFCCCLACCGGGGCVDG